MPYLCRLCLETSEFCFSLFTGNILEKIESLTCIKIEENDKLPKTCCETCVASVYSSYNFQQLIIESNKKLQEQGANELLIIEQAKLAPEVYEILIDEQEPSSEQDDYTFVVPKEEVDLDKYLSVVCKSEIDDEETTLNKQLEEGNLNESLDDSNVKVTEEVSNESAEESFLKYDGEEETNINSDIQNQFQQRLAACREKKSKQTALKCTDCDLIFQTKRLLQRHKVKHKIDKCPFCSITMRRDNLKRHMQIHTDSPEVCEICGTVAKNKESLRGHINYQHKSNILVNCEECDRSFKSNHHYKAHYRKIHLNIRNIQCHLCGKKFYAKHDMNKHINMTHKGARPHICEYCNRGFCSPYALKTHIRQHTLEAPYRCNLCPSSFRQKVSLNTHLKSRHNCENVEIKKEDTVDITYESME